MIEEMMLQLFICDVPHPIILSFSQWRCIYPFLQYSDMEIIRERMPLYLDETKELRPFSNGDK